MPTFFEALNELMASGRPLVTVTVVDTMGSVPQDRGSKIIVTAAGRQFGTVGGGKVETKAVAEAQRMLSSDEPSNTKFVSWSLNKDVGMTCGGIVKLYFEAFNVPRWKIVIFGAGHVAQALTRILVNLDCQITCIDPRAEWIEQLPQSPKLTPMLTPDMPSMVAKLPSDAFVLLMTMGHTSDKPILLEILRTRTFPYLGVIGSHSKAVILHRDIAEAGLPKEMQKAFFCPVGLEIGTNHPYEIAVSIVAQMLQVRDDMLPLAAPARCSPLAARCSLLADLADFLLRRPHEVLTPSGSVLIAEDDDTVRRLLIEYLKKHAYVTVEGARDGVEALHQLAQNRYSVVVLDLMMPKMSGTDVIDSLKAHMIDPSVKDLAKPPAIVVITSMSAEEISTDSLVHRCRLVRGVFRKPLDIVALGECVEQLLQERV